MNQEIGNRNVRPREFILRQVRVPSAVKSIAFAFLFGVFALALSGCPGDYQAGYGHSYYAPSYGGYYGSYGYNGAPYAYSGLRTSVLIGGVRHRRYYGRHHYYGNRRHYSRGYRDYRGRHR